MASHATEVPAGMDVRIRPDGSREIIPLAEFVVGDIILGEGGKKMRITTMRTEYGSLTSGRFQFAHRPGTWYSAKYHGNDTMHFVVDPPNRPFGREILRDERSGRLDVNFMFPETVVDVITFEEVSA